jgi:hypothetical protein
VHERLKEYSGTKQTNPLQEPMTLNFDFNLEPKSKSSTIVDNELLTKLKVLR